MEGGEERRRTGFGGPETRQVAVGFRNASLHYQVPKEVLARNCREP